MNEAALAAELGVSRNTVREAARLLGGEGLVRHPDEPRHSGRGDHRGGCPRHLRRPRRHRDSCRRSHHRAPRPGHLPAAGEPGRPDRGRVRPQRRRGCAGGRPALPRHPRCRRAQPAAGRVPHPAPACAAAGPSLWPSGPAARSAAPPTTTACCSTHCAAPDPGQSPGQHPPARRAAELLRLRDLLAQRNERDAADAG